MKQIKLIGALAFALAITTAFATKSKTNKSALITAYRVSGCSTSVSVACHTAAAQTCKYDFGDGPEDVKKKDENGACTITLARD